MNFYGSQRMQQILTYMKSLLESKQDKLTFDNIPTENSDNPVKSGGIYSSLESKADSNSLADVATSGAYADLSGKPTIDSAMSSLSENAVQNKVVNTALEIIKSAINRPGYSEAELCYAQGTSYQSAEVNPGRVIYIYQLDTSGSYAKVTDFFITNLTLGHDYLSGNEYDVALSKGTIHVILSNVENKTAFSLINCEEATNPNLVFLVGTVNSMS